jgi:glutathione transport system substrate-binding protein
MCRCSPRATTVSKDGLVYTIKLRSGVKFHDGTDFNAEAVKATLRPRDQPDNKLKRYNLTRTSPRPRRSTRPRCAVTLKEPFSPSSTRWRIRRP